MADHKYFLLHKPFGVLSQFTREIPSHQVLGDCFDFPPDVYPVGRLDRDSEGLLILTNDGQLNKKLLDPKQAHWRTYWVQVEGEPDQKALDQLSKGLKIRINKKDYQTLPAKAQLIQPAPNLPARIPPIRVRKTIPDTWMSLSLQEGKNRQVRRMCAKVGYPVLRLVRSSIGNLKLADWVPNTGQVVEIDKAILYQHLGL